MSGFFQVFYAVFSGILTSLAIPNEILPFGSPILGMIALSPLYLAVREAKSYRKAALLFAIDELTAHLLSSFWLANFKDFAIFTLGASAIGTACIGAMVGCLFFAPFALQKIGREKGEEKGRRILQNAELPTSTSPFHFSLFTVPWFACVRVLYEWAKSTGFLAYPWGTLSMTAFRSKILMQSADIFGVYGITFLFAFISGTLGEAITANIFFNGKECKNVRSSEPTRKTICTSEARKPFCEAGTAGEHFLHYSLIKCSLAMLVCFSLYGAYQLCVPRLQTKTLNAVLVQQNKDPWIEKNDKESIQISMKLSQDGIAEFEEADEKPDIVVWSEALLRSSFPSSYGHYSSHPDEESLIHFINRMNTPFLIGGAYTINREKRQTSNAALMFDKNGMFRGWYGKTHLVPFAEAVPGTEYPIIKNFLKKVVGFSNGWTPGQEFTLFDIAVSSPEKKPFPSFKIVDMEERPSTLNEQTKVRVATPICFEDAFPDICGPFHDAGAEVFLNITDDSWSLTNSAEYQHFVVASFRAIEYRTTLVRSTNAGFTTVVDPCGRILQSLPLFEEGHLCARVPIYAWKQTVHSRFTNWFVHLIMLFMLAVYVSVAVETVKGRSRREKKPSLKECVEAALSEIEF